MDRDQLLTLRNVASAHLFADSQQERNHAARIVRKIDARLVRLGGRVEQAEQRPRRYLLQ